MFVLTEWRLIHLTDIKLFEVNSTLRQLLNRLLISFIHYIIVKTHAHQLKEFHSAIPST